MTKYTHLKPEQLAIIDRMRKQQYKLAAIANILGCHPSTISRECKRTAHLGHYDQTFALEQRIGLKHKSACNARRYTVQDPIFNQIQTQLAQQYSPAQALASLRLKPGDCGPSQPASQPLPSRATLYRLLEPLGWYDRESYPSMRLRRYYSKTQLKQRASSAPNGWVAKCPTVDQRPSYLTDRSQSLCMEIDTIVGRKTDSARLVVAVCRKTRYTMIGLLKHCTASAVVRWVRARMRKQHLKLKCLIPDQGSEFARLPTIKSLTVYPCQPHRPWQKPTVENTNGLIRFYVPKGQLIKELTHERVAMIEYQLNHRPRLCLNWKTPAEVLYDLHPETVHFD